MSKFHQLKPITPAPKGILQKCGCGKSSDSTGECEECKAKKNEQAKQAVQSGGTELDASTRNFMESKFEKDFSNVRVHTDLNAAHASQKIGANAFTVGNDIAFAPGKYNPGTKDGKKLIAHELTHTLQQNEDVKMQATEQDLYQSSQQNVLEGEAKDMELQVGDEENHQEDFEYESDPELDGEIVLTEEEAAAVLEEADEQDAVAQQEEDSSEQGTDVGADAEEESNVSIEDATQLALPPKGERPKRKPRPAKHKPKEEKKKSGAKRIVVNLGKQEATAFEGDKPVKTMKISSGKSTNPTDQGATSITERDENHRSSKYGKCTSSSGKTYESSKGAGGCKKGDKYVGASMKYFQRFGGSAEGFHVGDVSRSFASHGCVRLSTSNAKWLWSWAKSGIPVNIISGTKKTGGRTTKKYKK